MKFREYFSRSKYFLFGSLSILISVVIYFFQPIYMISRSPPALESASSPFLVPGIFFALGIALIVWGYIVKVYYDALKKSA